MPVITRYRLDGGTSQRAARKLIPETGLLRRVVNMRLRRDSELEVRPGYSALTMSEYGGGTLTAYDLANYDGRLVALGKTTQIVSAPVSVYEYVGQADGAWRGDNTIRIPYLTKLRDVARPPEQQGGVDEATCAVANGIGALVYQNAASGDAQSYWMMFKPATRQTLQFARMTSGAGDHGALPKVIYNATDDQFFVLGLDAAGDLGALAIDADGSPYPGTGNTTELLTGLDSSQFACAPVTGGGSGYVIVAPVSGGLVVRHYNASHVQQMTVTLATLVVTSIAIEADATANQIVLLYRLTSDDTINVRSVQLDDGSAINGPTAVLSGTTGTGTTTTVSIARSSSTQVFLGFTGLGTSQAQTNVAIRLYTPSTDTLGSINVLHDADMSTQIALDTLIPMCGYVQGSTDQQVTCIAGFPNTVATPLASMGFGLGQYPAQNHALSFVEDPSTGRWYMVRLETNNNSEANPIVTEMHAFSTERRQMAEIGGLLFISGGCPVVYDGTQVVESGFVSAPRFYGVDHVVGAGSVTASARYFLQGVSVFVDARGNQHFSIPSEQQDLTTDAGDNTITGEVTHGCTLRRLPSVTGNGSALRIDLHRTSALSDGTVGENLYFDSAASPGRTDAMSIPVDFTLTATDATLIDNGRVIYTQGQTPVVHAPPPPCRFAWATRERLGVAGQPTGELWSLSKLLFPSEAVQFALPGVLGFNGAVSREILGMCSLEDAAILLTDRGIWEVLGEGPDHSGLGEFRAARRVATDLGIVNNSGNPDGWRSLVETEHGVWFQADDDKLALLTRGKSVQWEIGQLIRDELASFPVIVAAAHSKSQQAVAFAAQNAAGNDSRIFVLDLRRGVWFIDDDDRTVTALVDYQDRWAYSAAGAVYQADAAPATGAMPAHSFETHDVTFGTGDWGEVLTVGLEGSWQGDCTATLAITFDSGTTYTTIDTQVLTAANGYSTGAVVRLQKAVPNRRCARFGLRVSVTGGSATGGVRWNEMVMETQSAPGMARLAERDTH